MDWNGSWRNTDLSTMDMEYFDKDLYKKLHTSPFIFNYELPVPPSIFTTISKWLTDCMLDEKPEYADLLFNRDGKRVLLGITSNDDLRADEQATFARICGHVFSKGETIYRCRTCGLDETCVMCVNCFKSSEHEGHDIYFHVSPTGGGCCDCGDSEAWKTDIKCKIHSENHEMDTHDVIELPKVI